MNEFRDLTASRKELIYISVNNLRKRLSDLETVFIRAVHYDRIKLYFTSNAKFWLGASYYSLCWTRPQVMYGLGFPLVNLGKLLNRVAKEIRPITTQHRLASGSRELRDSLGVSFLKFDHSWLICKSWCSLLEIWMLGDVTCY